VNIYQASLLAMRRALDQLTITFDYLLLDAVKLKIPVAQKSLIHGDALCFSIAAASILAKVHRDAALTAWDHVFPEYGLWHNKGYSTPDHIAALERAGPTTLHRFSFEPVRNASRYQAWTGYPLARPVSDQGELFACP
jgi:ribonuclease HII